MRKLILSMHVSLDGFVGGPNGEMDWIKVDDEVFEYAGQLTDEADTALYGRNTYNMMEAYWPTAGDSPKASKHSKHHSAWYNRVNKVVISTNLKAGELSNVTIIANDITKKVDEIKQQSGKNIQIFGSPSACHALMKDNLIDEYWLFVNPVVLGAGIPLFKTETPLKLTLLSAKPLNAGVVVMHYETVR